MKDIMELMLRSRRSEATRETYRRNLGYFLEATGQTVEGFLALGQAEAVETVLRYKAHLLERGLAELTVNGRLAAIKALVDFARRTGHCQFTLEDVRGERAQAYRDTSGITVKEIRAMLAVPDRETVKGRRDFAILTLLWELALRRGEIVRLDVEDFDQVTPALDVLGKGRGSQKERMHLSAKAAQALVDWLEVRGDDGDALFTSLAQQHLGRRITGETVRALVAETCLAAGIRKPMSPHRIRHSSITAALEATNGDVVSVQKLSRHSRVETVLVYCDRIDGVQASITGQLSDLV